MPHYPTRLEDITIPDRRPGPTGSLSLGDLSAPRPREERLGVGGFTPSAWSAIESGMPVSGYSRQPDGSMLSRQGADLGRAVDETAGLRANAPIQPRPPVSLDDLSWAQIEADKRANQQLEDKYAPIYAGIARDRALEDERMNEPVRAQTRENTLRENAPAAATDLNDLGVSGPMRAGQVAPAQLKRQSDERARDARFGLADVQGQYGLKKAEIASAPTVSQEAQRALAQHQNRIVQGQERMRAAGLDEEAIAEETRRYIKERAPQYGDVLSRRFFPKALAQ